MLKPLKSLLGLGERVAIPEELWQAVLTTLPFVAARPAPELVRLREFAARFIEDKQMASAGGLDLTAMIQVHIAAQACLPILNLGLDWYRGWTSIVIYPDEFIVPRSVTDEDGVVHEYDDAIVGEAWADGPLLLAWHDVHAAAPRDQPYNLVLHEFTHKLDLLNGDADGIPLFNRRTHPKMDIGEWVKVLNDSYSRFNAELERIERDLPAHIEPESAEARPYYAHLPLDPYAAQDQSEFFAVSSETFFVDPGRMAVAFPDWTRLLELFFKQPLALS